MLSSNQNAIIKLKKRNEMETNFEIWEAVISHLYKISSKNRKWANLMKKLLKVILFWHLYFDS